MDPQKVAGVWFHSHEEDETDKRVYRSREYNFPPSRGGRESLMINLDGTAGLGEPGPTDAAEYRGGTWHLNENVLILATPEGRHEYEVEEVDEQLLVLRPR